ncbi:MAG: radical SAM protein [Alphaproteobacteria bacterium]|nr:radical SAM protein [Alphaproteobacteria bacterium]
MLTPSSPGTPASFDSHAADYAESWEVDPVARHQRAVVFRRLAALLAPGSRVLDVGCGTGVDAAWLREQGHHVVAIDQSPGMVEQARRRGVPARVLPVEEAGQLAEEGPFDLILMDFGVVNAVEARVVGPVLAGLLRPGGRLLVATMPRVHPAWLLGRALAGDVAGFRQRLRPVVDVPVGDGPVRTRYRSPRGLARDLGPAFRLRRRQGLSVCTPPPGGRARGLSLLAPVDRLVGRLPLARDCGDHVLVELERVPSSATAPPPPPSKLARRLALHHARATGEVRTLHTLVLHLTDGCNSRCVACDFRGPAGGEALDAAAVARLCREAVGLGAVDVLLTGGEPLLRQDIDALLATARATGLRPVLLTNGLLLRRHAAAVAAHAAEVVLSLDGHDAASYREARGIDGLAAVAAGISALRDAGFDRPVRARVTVTAVNAGRLPEIAAAARALGCDSVSFLAADLSGTDAFGRAQPVDPALVPDPEVVAEGLARARQAQGAFVVDSAFAEARIAAKYRADRGRAPHRPPQCDAPWTSVVVRPDLTLRPCFFIAADAPDAHARDHLAAGLFRMGRQLGVLRVEQDPRCARCVCWARLG